ncbi:MAG TPA: hypothetical protein PLM07_01040 [Candidatus Rifleibacterium sp.]|nr:hypothetical protein [Candidatus Rifleibacterium sp.]HPT44466.1 hypothetical protein [Candidatus Rifleibacterium sp.]
MRLNMNNIAKGLAVAAFCTILVGQSKPAAAVLEGSNREQMEFLDFSESMIRNGLYAKTGRGVFNRDHKGFVRGIKEHNAPYIYEPDVYTWELAMAEQRKKLAAMAPPEQPPVGLVTPTPMTPGGMLPTDPMPLTLTPVGPQAVIEGTGPLPADSQQRMNDMVYRARARGLHTGSDLRAEEIKQRLIQHMNSMGESGQPGTPSIPALMPAMPDLPQGRSGDSCDAGF